jgi:hypothetical protein
MNPNHVYARKAAWALKMANAESNRPRKRKPARVRYERPVLSEQSNWMQETGEYLGDGFAVSAQQRQREQGTRPFAGSAFSEVRSYHVSTIRPDGFSNR